MTKVLVEMEPELWSQAREYAKANDLTNNELVTLAVERLILPVAGRPLEPEPYALKTNSTVPYDTVVTVRYDNARDVTPMPYQEIERRTAPPLAGPSFGYSRPAPKPLKKTR